METGRKGLTRLVCLLGEGSQQEQLQRAAVRNRPFEQLVVKGWLSRGHSLLGGWRGDRCPSTAATSYRGLQLLQPLMKKTWSQQPLLSGVSGNPRLVPDRRLYLRLACEGGQ